MPFALRLARYRDIAAEVAARLLERPEEEVVVASRGMAEAIAAAMLERTPDGVAGVRLQTLNDLARRIVNDAGDYPHLAADDERRLAMRMAARAVDDPMMASRGMPAMLERSYRDVRDSGVTLAELDRRARREPLRNRARTQLIIRAWREYERLIAQSGAIDPADLLARAAALVARTSLATQNVAGFYDMTGAQRRLVEALRDAGRLAAVYIPAGESDAYAFARPLAGHFAGAELARDTSLHILEPAVRVTSHDTRVSELRTVCGEVRALLDDGVPPRHIGIVARSLDDYDLRLLNRFAAGNGFTTTSRDTLPLVAHRIGRAIASILRLRDRGFPRGDVLEVARDFGRDVDAIDYETRRARVAGGTSADLAKLPRRRPLEQYAQLVAELESLAPPAALRGSEWSERLAAILGRFTPETATDVAAAEAVDDVMTLFRRWPAMTFDAGAVLEALDRELPGGAASDLPAVFANDVMSFRGRSFQHLFAVRMQDDLFPQRRVDDPLLPDHDRRLLGLREIGDGRDEERLLFALLGDAAANLHFSFAATDGFGKVLRVSQFLWDKNAGRASARQENTPAGLLPEAGLKPGLHRQLQLLAKNGTQSEFDGYLFATEDDAEVRGRLMRALQEISPTQLEDFGECPQKFLLKHVLDVEDIDDPERELQLHHREKGKLDHEILERFYRAESEVDAIETLVDAAFDALESDQPPFNIAMREIERRATKRVLRDFVSRDLAELAELGLRPQHFEYRFGAPRHGRDSNHPEPFVVDAGGVPIAVEGSIDRVDAAADGRHRIVDYKSGKALRHKKLDAKIDRGIRLQLALYAMAAAEFFEAEAADVSGTIKPLVAGNERAETFAFDLAAKAGRLRETLDLFASSILRGLFPAFPNEDDDFNSCKYCPVKLSCRTKHDAELAFATRQYGEPRSLLETLS